MLSDKKMRGDETRKASDMDVDFVKALAEIHKPEYGLNLNGVVLGVSDNVTDENNNKVIGGYAEVALDIGPNDAVSAILAFGMGVMYHAARANGVTLGDPDTEGSEELTPTKEAFAVIARVMIARMIMSCEAMRDDKQFFEEVEAEVQRLRAADEEFYPVCEGCGERHPPHSSMSKEDKMSMIMDMLKQKIMGGSPTHRAMDIENAPEEIRDMIKDDLSNASGEGLDIEEFLKDKPEDFIGVFKRDYGNAVLMQDNPASFQRLINLADEAREVGASEVVVDNGAIPFEVVKGLMLKTMMMLKSGNEVGVLPGLLEGGVFTARRPNSDEHLFLIPPCEASIEKAKQMLADANGDVVLNNRTFAASKVLEQIEKTEHNLKMRGDPEVRKALAEKRAATLN